MNMMLTTDEKENTMRKPVCKDLTDKRWRKRQDALLTMYYWHMMVDPSKNELYFIKEP